MLRVLAPVLVTLAFSGCVADNGGEGFVIVANESIVAGTTSCTVSATSTGPFQSRGEISTGSVTGYVFTPVIQSQISSASTTDVIQRTITLQGANVSLSLDALTIGHADGTFTKVTPPPKLSTADAQFLSQFSGSVAPAGLTGVAFEIIPITTIAAIKSAAGAGATDTLDAEVTATIKPFGEMGGGRVDGHPFKYPVSVCSNCVVHDLGTCPAMNVQNKGNPCNVFQDGIVDCCESATGLVCPAQ